MKVESPVELREAYATQVSWLESRLESLKKSGTSETDATYVAVQNELNWARTAHTKIKDMVRAPKGRLVLVVKSKVAGLRDKVGRVTYVNTDRNYATVAFDGGARVHSLSLDNLLIVDMPVPSVRIPVAGMVVKFKDDSNEYVAQVWNAAQVFVEPTTSVNSGAGEWVRSGSRIWVNREKIETIDGVKPL
jgi:hypothetical protein